jgi:sugar phosphate permease
MSQAGAAAEQPQYESDLSFRKIKLATIISVTNLFASSLLAFGALTLVNVPLTTEFGWTQQQYSWATTSMLWCGSAAMPVYGHFVDRIGVRPVIILGTVAVGFCTFAMGFMTGALWQFYLLYGLLGLFGGTAMAYTKVIGALFTQHRGKAMALLGVESTLAAAALPPLLNWLITDYGWREMFIACGCVIFVLAPVVYFTLDEPGEIGSERKLFKRREQAERPNENENLPGLTASQVMRNRVYWLIVLATIVGTAPRTGMMPFLVPMMQEKGFTQADAATYMSVAALIMPAGTVIAGWALDRFNTARVAVPFQVVSFAGLFAFLLVTASYGGWPLLGVAIACGGFAFGTARPVGSYLHIRFFGLKAFGFYYGFENAFLAIAMGAAPPAVAALRVSSGSYTSSYTVMLVALAIGASIYWILGPYRYPANIGAVPVGSKSTEQPERSDGAVLPT